MRLEAQCTDRKPPTLQIAQHREYGLAFRIIRVVLVLKAEIVVRQDRGWIGLFRSLERNIDIRRPKQSVPEGISPATGETILQLDRLIHHIPGMQAPDRSDGASSRLRQQCLPEARMEETGIVSIGGKVALIPETKALLSDKVFHGISLIVAPKGYGAILHIMEFKRDRNGVKNGVGGNDADLISQWPGLYDNTEDYIMWGVWGAQKSS
jgi:hypothetical protein